MPANKLATVFVVSRRDGSLVEKKFPMDQELYRAIKSLPKEEQIRYFTEEYYQWKEEQNDHRYLISSIDSFDEEYQFVHDIPDIAPNPEEAYVPITTFFFEPIHPFYDGNGRLGRYIFSALLLQETDSVFTFLISSCIHQEKNKYYSILKEGEDQFEFGLVNEYVSKMIDVLTDGIESIIEELKDKKTKIESFSYDPDLSYRQSLFKTLVLKN